MPGPRDHITFLSQEVGPRPAGTEEEQQVALYITEQLQKSAGLPAEIEDFSSQGNEELPQAICVLLTLIFAIAAMVFPVMVIPAIIVCVLTGAVYCAETFGKPIISRFFARGVSQNIVAKYEPQHPSQGGSTRRRKIVLLANYDSGRVRSELSSPLLGVLPILQKITLGAMIFIPLFLIVRSLFFLHTEGGVAIALNIITVLALILAAIPLVLAIMHRFSPYNDAANSNASSVAVLLEVARRIGKERNIVGAYEYEGSGSIRIHGEEAARASGLVPEGARLAYEASQMQPPVSSPQSEEERLIAAKAAIAAMTGRDLSHTGQTSIADKLVQAKGSRIRTSEGEEGIENQEESDRAEQVFPEAPGRAKEVVTAKSPQDIPEQQSSVFLDLQEAVVEEPVAGSDSSVPDWFKKAQENAKKKPVSGKRKVVRSRYAAALDAAVAESANYFNQANEVTQTKTEERIKKMRDDIMEVSAPQLVRGSAEVNDSGVETSAAAANSLEPEVRETVSPEVERGNKKQIRGLDALIPEKDAFVDLGSTTAMTPLDVEDLGISSGNNSQSILDIESEQTLVDQASQAQEEVLEKSKAQTNKHQPIELPSISASTRRVTPIDTSKQQRAPLAQAEESKQGAAKSLLNMLPSIDVNEKESSATGESKSVETSVPSRSDLMNGVPSLSGILNPVDQNDDEGQPGASTGSTSSVSPAGSFASSGATGTFSPVGDELLEGIEPEDIYIDDADDSAYEGEFTESGAFAGPGYVEMPRSRARRFFDRFNFRKSKTANEEVSAQEWLDVDDTFDAREVGKERGGWESFQNSQDISDDDFDDGFDGQWSPAEQDEGARRSGDDWEGGAVKSREEEAESENFATSFDPDDMVGNTMEVSQSEEMQKIHKFRNVGFDTEVWFVALGSELANNGGMKALLREHEQDLKGSIFINLSALGAGELSYLKKEGFTGKAGASSRMKRYIKKASQSLGMNIEPNAIRWKESAATVAADKGLQAITLVGMDGQKPAGFAQSDDVIENIDEELLESNIDFVTEFIRSI